jgi:proline iminopeptidase
MECEAREFFVPASGGAKLYCREAGAGAPLVVVHGGPDFDHTYLLPDMDRLADAYRLVYYDQRGRGRSHGPLNLQDIDVDLFVEDLDALRRHLGLESLALVGHSWGGLLAMHYALAHPCSTSHLVLLNTAPASAADMELAGKDRVARRARYGGRMEAIASSAAFIAGEAQAVSEYWSLDFATTFRRPEDARRLKIASSREDTLRGRAIEERLMERLYGDAAFTLLPRLETLRGVPTLVIHGELDFIPVRCSERIARAIAGAKLVVLPESGHFSYIDAPQPLRDALEAFYPATGSRV